VFWVRLLVATALLCVAMPTVSGAQSSAPNQPWDRSAHVDQLPDGPLYWAAQTFDSRDAAEEAAGETGLVGEAEGLVWLFTLGRAGEAPSGGTLLAEIGPLEVPSAEAYQLLVNYRTTAPGVTVGATQGVGVHAHPGWESCSVMAGEQTVWTPGRQQRTEAGDSWIGQPPGTLTRLGCSLAPTKDNSFSGNNRGHWCDPEFDRLAGQVRATLREQDRGPIVARLQDLMLDDLRIELL